MTRFIFRAFGAGLFAMSLVSTPSAFGQSMQVAPPPTGAVARPTATASQVAEGPAIDGDVLGEAMWQQATPIAGFVQESPDEGRPVSERTEVRMIFTRDTLYIGVVCYDREPSGIIVSDSRRDSSLENTDSFRVIFDTFRDRQNGFVFGTNPTGLEYDGQVTNEGQGGGGLAGAQMQQSGSGSGFNLNWDGAWAVRAKTTEIGWTAEFAIPFKTLRYPSTPNQVWGVNFQRNIRRKNESAFWSPIPRQYNLYRVSIAGTVAGLQPPAFRNFKVTPYVLGELQKSGVNPVDGVRLGDFGVDAKYNLTPGLTLDATYNTDFAQVEVDDQQVNLDRFNLFFPEKRPFFLENAGFFSVGNPGEVDLFFSRRIGIGPGGEVIPIYGGGRVSGKAGSLNVGLLNMQTEEEAGIAPGNNFSVVRLSQELPNRSAIGGIFVNRAGFGDFAKDEDTNQTYAIDGKWGIGRNNTLSGFIARTATPGETDGREYAFNIRSRILRPRYDIDLGYQEVGDTFNPEVGFLSRKGYRKPDVRLMTRFRPKEFWNLQEVRPHATFRGFWGYDNFQETGFAHLDNHWQFKNSWEVHTGMNVTREGLREPFQIYPGIFVPMGTYDNAEAQLVMMTDQSAKASLSLQTFMGGFFSGDRVTLSPTIRLRPSEGFNMELAYQWNNVNLPQGEFETNLVRTRFSYSFTTRIFTQALVQYNDRADLWSMNLRFGWLQAANTGLFIVYNDSHGLYDLFPDRAERTDRSLTLKFSRLFDVLR